MGQRMILGNRDFGAMASRPLPGQSAGLIAQSRTTTPQTGGHVITLRVQLHIWMCSPLTLLAELAHSVIAVRQLAFEQDLLKIA
jgi:hypothetical protein